MTLFTAPSSKAFFSPVHTRNGAFLKGFTFEITFQSLRFYQLFGRFSLGGENSSQSMSSCENVLVRSGPQINVTYRFPSTLFL